MTSLIHNNTLQLERLAGLTQKPALFAPGERHFWDDPHIARQMLKHHLDPEDEAASRRPETIDAIVSWIISELDLHDGDRLLDLGCGPGLYCCRFSERGLDVTGVDLSRNSLRYARMHDPLTTYIQANYTMLALNTTFRAVTLIYGDFNVLPDDKRDTLLTKINRLLPPGGYFVFDVTTWAHHAPKLTAPQWSLAPEGGFWKATPHITLESAFNYPEHDTMVQQYAVIENDGTISIYRNWFHYYSPETITGVLTSRGFEIAGLYSDLTGTPLTDDSAWLGVVARKL